MKTKFFPKGLLACVVIALAANGQSLHATPSYTFTDLGTVDGYTDSVAYGVNDSGQVVGMSFRGYGTLDYTYTAFLYSGGTMQNLGTLDGYSTSVAFGINNSGDIVGGTSSYGGHVLLFSGGSIQNLGFGLGLDINDAGQIVGTNNNIAFLYSGGTMQSLGTLAGASSSYAFGINSNGDVVGESDIASRSHAFLYSGGTMQDLGDGYAGSINDAGEIVGSGIYSDGSFHVPVPEFNTIDINNLGNIVGQMIGGAALYQNGIAYNLNDVITNGPGDGFVLQYAYSISNTGYIAGDILNIYTGQEHAFLLTPTPAPEPSTWALLGLGALLVMGVATGRKVFARQTL